VTPVVLKKDTYILEKRAASTFRTDVFIPVRGAVGTTGRKKFLLGVSV
jgi:hypothetical protein